jgi:hypothetical protein
MRFDKLPRRENGRQSHAVTALAKAAVARFRLFAWFLD